MLILIKMEKENTGKNNSNPDNVGKIKKHIKRTFKNHKEDSYKKTTYNHL